MEVSPSQQNRAHALPFEAAVSAQEISQNREIIQAVKRVNAAELFGDQSELTFVRDRETRKPVIRVVDRETREVLLQLPPEYVLHLAEDLDKPR